MGFHITRSLIIFAAFALPPQTSHAAELSATEINEANHTSNPIQNLSLEKFRPQPQSSTKLDYQYLDNILYNSVFFLGLSDRVRRVNRTRYNNGKRSLTVGHQSPYRVEGSRIYLKNPPLKFDENMTAYREDLQDLAMSLPLTHLSRDEQLAFWLNIHNVAVIELLSQQRRARYTEEKRFGPQKEALHDVKIIEIGDTALSLRDVREKIVYPNWKDPSIMYGFFMGNIGSPALRNVAYKGDTVKALLKKNAEEFTNSLRGFEIYNDHPQISELYLQNAPIFFPQFNRDLKLHFKKYMRPEIYELTQSVDNFTIAPYANRVASLTAGRYSPRQSILVVDTSQATSGLNAWNGKDALGFLTKDFAIKQKRLEAMGLLGGNVIIEDIETEDLP